jgi:hypothetical protein
MKLAARVSPAVPGARSGAVVTSALVYARAELPSNVSGSAADGKVRGVWAPTSTIRAGSSTTTHPIR